MVNLVLKFAQSCRAAELGVSTAEVLDTIRQLEYIEVLDESQFRTVLRSNFSKSRRDQGLFDSLYDLFFHDMCEDACMIRPDAPNHPLEHLFDELKRENQDDEIFQAITDFLAGDAAGYIALIHKIQVQPDVQTGVVKSNLASVSNKLSVMLKLNRVREAAARFSGDIYGPAGNEERKRVDLFLNHRLNRAFEMLQEDPRPKNDSMKQVLSREKRLGEMGERSFASLSPREVEDMRALIDQLARKLRDIVSRRYKARKKGVLDVKKTLRRSAGHQGVPIDVRYREKPPRKGRVVTLCDVSGSVWSAARFMLNMLYSLHDCFSQIRSYVFVSGLAEVSDIFEHYEINDAIERVMTHPDIRYQELTDYGETFRRFQQHHMDQLTRKTTLIIVGDGRSNYLNPQEAILEEMRKKSRRIIWLNPEDPSLWNTGDSEMHRYKACCHELRSCRNLNQLFEFVEDLVL